MADMNPTVLNALSIKTTESNQSTPVFQLGNSGVSINAIRKSTVSVALGTVAHDSITTAVTISGITVGDPIIAVVPSSLWSGAYYDITLGGRVTAADTFTLAAVNSTLTGINTTAMNMDVFWLDLA